MVHETEPLGRRPAQATGAGTAQEKRRSEKLRETLPRGIVIGERFDGRPKPWFVRWGPKRIVESFETEQARNDRAAKLAEDRDKEGVAALDYDPAKYKRWLELEKRTGASVDELEEAWRARPKAVASPMLVADAVAAYMALRLTEDVKKKTDTYRHIKLHLVDRFIASFGPKGMDAVTTEELREWFAGLKDPDTGKPLSNTTKRDHRKDVNTFFKRAVREEWCRRNPCERVVPPKVVQRDKPPMPVRDIFQLLKANRDEPVVGRIALELFGSLRTSSAGRCEKAWIKWEAKGIRMPGVALETDEQQHKSGKSKYRQGHPPVLWDWLRHAGEPCWEDITEGNYGHKKVQAFIRANVKNPGNGLRRSCASYQLALTKSVGPVSYLMQHKHTSTTEIYEGEADESDARLFMAITPAATLLTWDEFVKSTKAAA